MRLSISLAELAREFDMNETEIAAIAVANGIPIKRSQLGMPRISTQHYLTLRRLLGDAA